MSKSFKDIRPGDRVTILIPNGIGRDGVEWKAASGRAVFKGAAGNWVLNMGGRHGNPAVASPVNFLRFTAKRKKSAMDVAAEAAGLKKVRGALGGIYYE